MRPDWRRAERMLDRLPVSNVNRKMLNLFANLALSSGDLLKQVTVPDDFEPAEIDVLRKKKIDSLYYLSRNVACDEQEFYRAVWRRQREAFLEVRGQALAAG